MPVNIHQFKSEMMCGRYPHDRGNFNSHYGRRDGRCVLTREWRSQRSGGSPAASNSSAGNTPFTFDILYKNRATVAAIGKPDELWHKDSLWCCLSYLRLTVSGMDELARIQAQTVNLDIVYS